MFLPIMSTRGHKSVYLPVWSSAGERKCDRSNRSLTHHLHICFKNTLKTLSLFILSHLAAPWLVSDISPIPHPNCSEGLADLLLLHMKPNMSTHVQTHSLSHTPTATLATVMMLQHLLSYCNKLFTLCFAYVNVPFTESFNGLIVDDCIQASVTNLWNWILSASRQ